MKAQSSLGMKYPSLRDHPLRTGLKWLEGKRRDDGAEDLWRIHDNLYDLTGFVASHPGGREWLELTKGTDITEAFEAHHLSNQANSLLPKFLTRPARTKRNSPFTFSDDGFYRTLKRNIVRELPKVPKGPVERSKRIADLLLGAYVVLAVLAAARSSFALGLLAGICLSLMAIAAHNFFHQRNNFRMYYFDFTLMQSKNWRISHALSHHLYTNTINDLEISTLEPFLHYLPQKKYPHLVYVQWIISPIFYCCIFFGEFTRSVLQLVLERRGQFNITQLLPFTILVPMTLLSPSLQSSIIMFLYIQTMASLHFGIVGLNAAHHHPDIFHDGDTSRPPQELDWGVHQLDAVMDRKDITGSHFLVITNFGDHALHHLFPTLDHGLLEFLYPVFLKTCIEFGVDWKISSQLELVKGQYLQLVNTSPRKLPPRPLKTNHKMLLDLY